MMQLYEVQGEYTLWVKRASGGAGGEKWSRGRCYELRGEEAVWVCGASVLVF